MTAMPVWPALFRPWAARVPICNRWFVAREPFEHGQMIWRKDLSVIYALQSGPGPGRRPGGRWAEYPDTWREGLPESDPALQPPAGLRQPVRGFGKVWREQLGGPAGGRQAARRHNRLGHGRRGWPGRLRARVGQRPRAAARCGYGGFVAGWVVGRTVRASSGA